MSRKYFSIAIEGVSGAGKSALCGALETGLRERGSTVGFTNCFACERIDDYCKGLIMTEKWAQVREASIRLLQFLSHYELVVEQMVTKCDVLIVEKYFFYYGALTGMSSNDVKRAMIHHLIPKPDMIIFIDRDPAECYAYLSQRRPVRFYETGLYRSDRPQEGLLEFSRGKLDDQMIRQLFIEHQGMLAANYREILSGFENILLRAYDPSSELLESVLSRVAQKQAAFKQNPGREPGI